MKAFSLFLLLCFYLIIPALNAQTFERSVSWNNPQPIILNDSIVSYSLNFNNAIYPFSDIEIPQYFELFSTNNANHIIVSNIKWDTCTADEVAILKRVGFISEQVDFSVTTVVSQGVEQLSLAFIPIRLNQENGLFEKISVFELSLVQKPVAKSEVVQKLSKSTKQNSVLVSGDFYKVCVSNTGLYKITHSDLVKLGIDPANINPQNISIYGNGGGMLSEVNNVFRQDDLIENNILVSGEQDGVFNTQDNIIFYAKGPTSWKYNSTDKKFKHTTNLYSDNACYFLTIKNDAGKRIAVGAEVTDAPTTIVTNFSDYAYHELNSVNLLKTGREWFGESFSTVTSYDYVFSFPNIDVTTPVSIKTEVIARSSKASQFKVIANGTSSTILVDQISLTNYNGVYAQTNSSILNLVPSSSTINVNVSYSKPVDNAIGWLNYIELNAKRNLSLYGSQMLFRNVDCIGANAIAKFELGNANSSVQILDVTNPLQAQLVPSTLTGSTLSFVARTDSLREFVAFNGISFLSPTLIGKIANQNLHSLQIPDMLIVTHSSLVSAAERVAKLHRQLDTMLVHVVTVDQVYNEFSSGVQDICAIRDFAKMFYDRDALNAKRKFKYLLLLGDGSYDYKSRIQSNSNLIPTYESVLSLQPIGSYLTDDFFGLLDDGEGANSNGSLDIGIGRFPVKTLAEATDIVDKIYRYTSATNLVSKEDADFVLSNYGDWRNIITFIGDDEDNNLHVDQADKLATLVDTSYKQFNVEKIYLDAYKQESNSSGQRYPEVNTAINNRINRGALIMNYSGHGGELGLAHERILGLTDINSWSNTNNLMVFVTATCEFSRFDDPERTAAGEYVLLSSKGGAIALYTTTRLAFASSNYNLNKSFYDFAFTKVDGDFPKLGDLIRQTKNANANNENIKNFVLLGDPALQIVYPKYRVMTTMINADSVIKSNDTIHALSKVTIKGYIADDNGVKVDGFNGTISSKVFDKASFVTTNANDASSAPKIFKVRNNVLYKGKASVVNSDFTYTFIVPKDIAYNVGFGKISHYALADDCDANGYYDQLLIGGFTSDYVDDAVGPQIELYMNDTTFRTGGITDENPSLLACISDLNGVNTTGNGIGHDIIAVLDEETSKSVILNDYYQASLDSYNKGQVRYPYAGLSEGVHTLTVRVWDIFNNTSTATIDFVVQNSIGLSINEVKFYPNPLNDNSVFYFEHNWPNKELEVEVGIYSIDGRLIKLLGDGSKTHGYNSQSISWDGKDSYGTNVQQGIYIYHLKVVTTEGNVLTKSGKLIVLR